MRARTTWVLAALAGALFLGGCEDAFFHEPADGRSVPLSLSYALAPEFANLATPLEDFQNADEAEVLIEASDGILFDGRVPLSLASNGVDKAADVRVLVGDQPIQATATVSLLVSGTPVLQGTGSFTILSEGATGGGIFGTYHFGYFNGAPVSLPQTFVNELGPGCDLNVTSFTLTLSPDGSWLIQYAGDMIDRTGETAGCGGPYEEILAAGSSFQQTDGTVVLTAFDGSTISAQLSGNVLTVTDPEDGVFGFEKADASSVEIFLEPVTGGGGGEGAIEGTVVNASDGAPVANASVEVLQGSNASGGTPVGTAVSDASGQFSVAGLADGDYTLVVTASGFIQARQNVSVVGGGTTTRQVALSTQLGADQTRIVLTWGASPPDLDSNLTGPDGQGGTFRVYFGSRGSQTASPFASLDVDDTSGFGPETTTIWQQFSGTYCFSVHNFSQTGDFTGATVEVFQGASKVAEFTGPAGSGTLWTVFSLNGTTLTTVDQVGTAAPPGVCQ